MSLIPTAPVPTGGQGFKPSEHVGSLIHVDVLDYDQKAATPWGVRPEVLANVDVIAGRSQVGEHFDALRLSGRMLAPQLGECVGREVFGRLASLPGRNANPSVYLETEIRPDDVTLIDAWCGERSTDPPAQPPAEAVDPSVVRYNQHPPKGATPSRYPPHWEQPAQDKAPF